MNLVSKYDTVFLCNSEIYCQLAPLLLLVWYEILTLRGFLFYRTTICICH